MAAHHSHKHYHIVIIVFLVFALLVGLKFLSAKNKWNSYVVDSQKSVMKYKALDSVEDAGVVASVIISVPANNPILKQPIVLQDYVQTVSKHTGRDIVVVDNNKKILADTVVTNVGKTYSGDAAGDVAATIKDGQVRTFIEKSVDYPNGIEENVISFKNLNGQVVGAIIMSNSNIFN